MYPLFFSKYRYSKKITDIEQEYVVLNPENPDQP